MRTAHRSQRPTLSTILAVLPISQVQLYDQIVFESVKSPGHYFHVSECCQIDHFSKGYVCLSVCLYIRFIVTLKTFSIMIMPLCQEPLHNLDTSTALLTLIIALSFYSLTYECVCLFVSRRSELNLGVERSSFTLIGSYRERPERGRFVRVGSENLTTAHRFSLTKLTRLVKPGYCLPSENFTVRVTISDLILVTLIVRC